MVNPSAAEGYILNEFLVAIFLLGTFFITSANSGTTVLGMFSSGGDLNIAAAFPFCFVMIAACYSLLKALKRMN